MKKIIVIIVAAITAVSVYAQTVSNFTPVDAVFVEPYHSQNFGMNAGAVYIDGKVRPIAGFSYECEFQRFALEMALSSLVRENQFDNTSYFSCRTMAMLKYGVLNFDFPTPWDHARHQVSVVAGGGIQLSREEEDMVSSMSEIEEYHIYSQGWTSVFTGGLEYQLTFKSGNSIAVKALLDYNQFALSEASLGGILMAGYKIAF